jgi:RecA-family ATPase
MNSVSDVRSVLRVLQKLAQKYNCAIILVMHMNKNSGTNKATNRVMGSYDFVATCRSVILIENNPENPEEKLFIPIKCNLAKEN